MRQEMVGSLVSAVFVILSEQTYCISLMQRNGTVPGSVLCSPSKAESYLEVWDFYAELWPSDLILILKMAWGSETRFTYLIVGVLEDKAPKANPSFPIFCKLKQFKAIRTLCTYTTQTIACICTCKFTCKQSEKGIPKYLI